MAKRKIYTESFKLQLVQLYHAGATQAEIRDQYNIAPSTLHQWITKYDNNGITDKIPLLSPAEVELIETKRKLKYAEMELDILKQAALIMGRK